jgi:predicted porin
MKKSLLAVAVAAALPTAAMAQSNVTLYGLIDLAVENVSAESGLGAGLNAGKSATRVTSGVQTGSRIGVRGTEDIGGGLRGVFTIEHRLNADDGYVTGESAASTAPSRFWAGEAWAGLEGGFGRLTLGRQYTPIFRALQPADYSGYNFYNNWVGYQGPNRTDNMIQYRSPTMGGATIFASYTPGEAPAVNGNQDTNDNYAIGLQWQMGAIYAGLGYHSIQDLTAATSVETVMAAALGYRTAGWGASIGYTSLERVDGNSTDNVLGSAFVSLAGGSLIANVIQQEPATGAKATNFGLTYSRPLSKRTNWYTALGQTEVAAGDDRRIALGMRHNF